MKVFYGENFISESLLKQEGIMHPIKLEYYKMIDKQNLSQNDNKIYGIKIIKTEYKQDDICIEEKELKNLTNNEVVVDGLLNLFNKNLVTPISANDIIDDLLKKNFN